MHKRQRTLGSKSMNQKTMKKMAGVLGFEPRDAEIKTRCNYVDINEMNGAGRGT